MFLLWQRILTLEIVFGIPIFHIILVIETLFSKSLTSLAWNFQSPLSFFLPGILTIVKIWIWYWILFFYTLTYMNIIIITSILTGDSLWTMLLSLLTSLLLRNIFKQKDDLWSRIVKRNLILSKNLFVLSRVSTQMLFKVLTLSNSLFKHFPAISIEFGTNIPKSPILLSTLKLGGMIIIIEI